MNVRQSLLAIAAWLCAMTAVAATKPLILNSPDGKISVEVSATTTLTYSVTVDGNTVMTNNAIDLKVRDMGLVFGGSKLASTHTSKGKETIKVPFYRNPEFTVEWNALTLRYKNGFGVEFRAFNDGVAYRLASTKMAGEWIVEDENAEFNFASDNVAWLPFSTNAKKPEAMAFQAVYNKAALSQQPTDNLAFLPATVDCGKAKVTIMESDLESWPGMFVKSEGQSLKGWFARFPKTFYFSSTRMQQHVESTNDYMAECKGNHAMPWRIMAISREDTEMPVNNLVVALAKPAQISDTSWIKPGLVSWDWWNGWGIKGVNFKAGVNMPTYKYYIDFAADYHLPYIILDEGWYEPKSGDMTKTIPEIDLPELIAYAKSKNVQIILWTVFNVLDKDLDNICRQYAEMGIAGFKVDFLDRDDQQGVELLNRVCKACAEHRLVLDLHGVYKPTGINRTWPNVLNFESVFGMEEVKWTKRGDKDMPLYDVTFPFIRMQTGFVDFTPGGMRNATRMDYQPIYYNPITMGTRCHQMAMYVVHDSPLTMLADNPTIYKKESECTSFIAQIPTVFDRTVIPQGKIGEYIVTAREKDGQWWVGAQTSWTPRSLDLTFGFLPENTTYEATVFVDGMNAGMDATDYRVENYTVTSETKLSVQLASGGGMVMALKRK